MKRIKTLLLLALSLTTTSALTQHAVNVQDSLALIDLYDSTGGSNWVEISGWKNGPVSTWDGVTITDGRVTGLILPSAPLYGSLPQSFGNLTKLQDLNFGNADRDDRITNGLSSLPESFGNLTNLESLDLAYNDLPALPESFGNLANLQFLNLEYNDLSSLPASFSNLTKLQGLNLNGNRFSSLPESFGNLAGLTGLELMYNQLSSLPESLGNLTGLQFLSFYNNQLSVLPQTFANLTNLQYLDLGNNKFTFAGLEWVVQHLPSAQYTDQNVIELIVAGNTLIAPVGGTPKNNTFNWYRNGQLDTTIQADSTYTVQRPGHYRVVATNAIVTQLALGSNTVTFQQAINVQDSLALVDLYNATNGPGWLNNLGWTNGPVDTWFGVSVTEDRVTGLSLSDNQLIGSIPASFGNLISLQHLTLSGNQLSSIPASFGNLMKLQGLYLYGNQLSALPESFGNLTGLQYLLLHENQLGALPESFSNLTNLQELTLYSNQLRSLPTFFGNLTNLQILGLSSNQLSSLPASFGNLSNLNVLNLNANQLSSVPVSFSNLTNLYFLDLSNNKFTFAGLEALVQHQNIVEYYYAPQDTVELVRNGNILVAAVGGTPKNNTFYWYRDNKLEIITVADSTLTPLRAGLYRVEVRNSIATQLTLNSNIADYVPDCDVCNTVWYRDADGDGFGNPASIKVAGKQPNGYVSNNLDCNDKNKTKGGPEVCDGRDNDCDGTIDNGFALQPFFSDWDGDGFGTPKRMVMACEAPPRFIADAGDFNDDNKNTYPGAPEICDGRDNNQNGTIDEGFARTTFYHDFDKDGYGRAEVTLQACAAPLNYVAVAGDCDDRDATIHPGAKGSCNGKDDDCDGLIDEACRNSVTQSKEGERQIGGQDLDLKVIASPNPATHYFTLRLQNSSGEPVQLRIVDAVGRIVEVRQGVASNSTIMVGHNYKAGTYLAQVLQGGKRVNVKLVKQTP